MIQRVYLQNSRLLLLSTAANARDLHRIDFLQLPLSANMKGKIMLNLCPCKLVEEQQQKQQRRQWRLYNLAKLGPRETLNLAVELDRKV